MSLNEKTTGTRIQRTMGRRLNAMRAYSGLSLAEVAKRGGYRGASSVQKLFHPDYNPPYLPKDVAAKLAKAFVGAGDPPIRQEEITGLTEDALEIETLIADLTHLVQLNSDKISLFRTEKTSDTVPTDNGHNIPLFVRSENKNGDHIPCPKHLRGKQLVGQFVSVGNMWPRIEEGEVIFYEHRNPPIPGDDVVVTISAEQGAEGMVIGRLLLLTDDEVRFAVLSPRDLVCLPRKKVKSIHRLVRAVEMLEPPQSMI